MSIMHELTVGFFASQAFSIIIVLVADAQLREDVCPAKSIGCDTLQYFLADPICELTLCSSRKNKSQKIREETDLYSILDFISAFV
jgi:hypothetical protein